MENIAKALIKELRDEWKPEVSTVNVVYYHTGYGSDSNIGNYELYWDVHTNEWTDKETAFRGYVFQYITRIIREGSN